MSARFDWLRRIALRLVLGRSTYGYLVRVLAQDMRVRTARSVDIVVRKDGRERRVEADWVKRIARLCWPDIERERVQLDRELAEYARSRGPLP